MCENHKKCILLNMEPLLFIQYITLINCQHVLLSTFIGRASQIPWMLLGHIAIIIWVLLCILVWVKSSISGFDGLKVAAHHRSFVNHWIISEGKKTPIACLVPRLHPTPCPLFACFLPPFSDMSHLGSCSQGINARLHVVVFLSVVH